MPHNILLDHALQIDIELILLRNIEKHVDDQASCAEIAYRIIKHFDNKYILEKRT